MKRRRGRPRKPGARHRSGDLKREAKTPRQVAAGMPHRRGLGEQAADQRAETELGRLVLRGVLDETLGLAGETYLALWRGYVMSIAGPAELNQAGGHGFTCDGCEAGKADKGREFCRCYFRRRIYEEAHGVLLREGRAVSVSTTCVVIHDLPALMEVELVRRGLTALAVHFGLTPRRNAIIGKHKIGSSLAASPK